MLMFHSNTGSRGDWTFRGCRNHFPQVTNENSEIPGDSDAGDGPQRSFWVNSIYVFVCQRVCVYHNWWGDRTDDWGVVVSNWFQTFCMTPAERLFLLYFQHACVRLCLGFIVMMHDGLCISSHQRAICVSFQHRHNASQIAFHNISAPHRKRPPPPPTSMLQELSGNATPFGPKLSKYGQSRRLTQEIAHRAPNTVDSSFIVRAQQIQAMTALRFCALSFLFQWQMELPLTHIVQKANSDQVQIPSVSVGWSRGMFCELQNQLI